MAEEDIGKHAGGAAAEAEAAAAVHIVYVLQPEGGEEPEAFHVRTLASVLGSEAAAREALVYSYSHAASGFAAKLTPHQAAEIQKLPGVLQVQPDGVYELHAGPTTFHQAHEHDL